MKYSQLVGIVGSLLLAAASFMPWAWYPDLGKEFTGFFSEQDRYGRPGDILLFFCVVMILLFVIPRIWAKRTNIFMAAITLAFVVRCYILYTGCYRGICPEKRVGIFLVLLGAVIAMTATLLPRLPVGEETTTE